MLKPAFTNAALLQPQDRLRSAVAVVGFGVVSYIVNLDLYGTTYIYGIMVLIPVLVGLAYTIQPC